MSTDDDKDRLSRRLDDVEDDISQTRDDAREDLPPGAVKGEMNGMATVLEELNEIVATDDEDPKGEG